MDLLTELYIKETTQLIESLENKLSGQLSPFLMSVDDIHQCFRNVHTIKSSAAMMQNETVATLAHTLEDLFEPMRSSQKGHFVDQGFAELVVRISSWLKKHLLPETIDGRSTQEAANLIQDIQQIRMEWTSSQQPTTTAVIDPPVPFANVSTPSLNPSLSSARTPSKPSSKSLSNYILVNSARLANLIERSEQIASACAELENNPNAFCLSPLSFLDKIRQIHDWCSQLSISTREIQRVPLNETVVNLNRLADDVAAMLGKKIAFASTGDEVELGSHMLNHIADSLIHLIRNAIDHGIEYPKERHQLGKPEIGRLTIDVRQTLFSILISVEDDGRGLDPALILLKAEQLSLLDRPASRYLETEAIDLVFTPGFSTKSEISSLSGRGVGLDVVKDLIQSMGGQVRVESMLGQGTRFTLEIPK